MGEYGWLIFWAAVMVFTVVIEALTTDMVSIWFTPGAFAAMILSMFVEVFWIQLVVFLVLSLVLLLVTRRYFKKHPFTKKSDEFNADSLIGQTAIVQDTIDNIRQTGSVKAKHLVWTARAENDADVIPDGSVVTIVKIIGVKLICKPLEE